MVDGCMPYKSLSQWKLKDAKLFGIKTFDLKKPRDIFSTHGDFRRDYMHVRISATSADDHHRPRTLL